MSRRSADNPHWRRSPTDALPGGPPTAIPCDSTQHPLLAAPAPQTPLQMPPQEHVRRTTRTNQSPHPSLTHHDSVLTQRHHSRNDARIDAISSRVAGRVGPGAIRNGIRPRTGLESSTTTHPPDSHGACQAHCGTARHSRSRHRSSKHASTQPQHCPCRAPAGTCPQARSATSSMQPGSSLAACATIPARSVWMRSGPASRCIRSGRSSSARRMKTGLPCPNR